MTVVIVDSRDRLTVVHMLHKSTNIAHAEVKECVTTPTAVELISRTVVSPF